MSSQVNPEVSALAGRPRAAGTAAPEPPPVPWASAAPQPEAPAAAPARAPRTTRGRWLTLLAGVVAAGAVLGAVGAAATAPMRRAPAVVATPLAAPAARTADAPADAAPAVAPSDAPAGAGNAGARGSGNAAAAPRANGVIASVDGDTIIVNTANGPVRVTLAPNANVQKQVPAERSELAAGQRVVVTGEQAADGAVTASGVQIVSGNDPSAAGDAPAGGTGRNRR